MDPSSSADPQRLPLSVQISANEDKGWQPLIQTSNSSANGRGSVSNSNHNRRLVWVSIGVAVVALILSIAALSIQEKDNVEGLVKKPTLVSRIAFGSCSSYDLRPQPIWTEGIIPTAPDVWIWAGDMAYFDTSPISCTLAPQQPECNCTLGYIKSSKGQCMAGDYDYALGRVIHQLSSLEYRAFLAFMCPAWGASSTDGAPPDGTNTTLCPRIILGTYDDHDYGWNNGNGRLPGKDRFKGLFLDAIGEPAGSSRRSASTGLQAAYTLNKGQQGREVEVVLLDGRYYRETLPCSLRRDWCTGILAAGPTAPNYAWCADFLGTGGAAGSCCVKDDTLALWCNTTAAASHSLYAVACDPTSSLFASRRILVDDNNSSSDPNQWAVREALSVEWEGTLGDVGRVWPWLTQDSPTCEMLGRDQRAWLAQRLSSSNAPLKLVVSGSVPVGSVGFYNPGDNTYCSGDDWNCYGQAQINFLHTVANASGCVVILTGDYHYADIKVVKPGADTQYASTLRTSRLQKPIYQLLASGMTNSTAKGCSLVTPQCAGSYYEDKVGLRPGGACALTAGPNFGVVEVDWDKRVAVLQVRDATGAVATSCTGQRMELTISLSTCAVM